MDLRTPSQDEAQFASQVTRGGGVGVRIWSGKEFPPPTWPLKAGALQQKEWVFPGTLIDKHTGTQCWAVWDVLPAYNYHHQDYY